MCHQFLFLFGLLSVYIYLHLARFTPTVIELSDKSNNFQFLITPTLSITCHRPLLLYVHCAMYTTHSLRSLRPKSPRPPPVDTSFIRPRKRGRKGRVKAKFGRRPFKPFMPCVMTGNVRSLKNKSDELCSMCKHSKDYSQASIIALTETWLTPSVPSTCFDVDNYSLYRCDRNSAGKRIGGGVCTYINNKWCHPNNINVRNVYTDNNIELLTLNIRPYYLPREFTNVICITVYIPPSADGKLAKDIIFKEIQDSKSKSPDAILILTGDFNHCRDFTYAGLTQYVNCCTRENNTLDLFFCNIKNSYKCLPRAPLGRSDHSMLLLLPKYRPVVKRVKPVRKCVEIWNENVCEELRGCFECTDWDVFIESCESVDELNDCITEYIKFCQGSICFRKEIIMYPNNKPWVSKKLKFLLIEKKKLFYNNDLEGLKMKQREIKGEITRCKDIYKSKIQKCFSSGNLADTWKGLKTAVNYQPKAAAVPDSMDVNSLNEFYCRFDAVDNHYSLEKERQRIERALKDDMSFEVSEEETRAVFSRINEKKAAGPDGVNGKVLKECAQQLAPIFTHIFNMSANCISIPRIWKTSKIVPVPKKDKITSMNDLRPVALTSIVMKSYERLILGRIRNAFMPHADCHQFAYRSRRSVEDALLLFTDNIYKHLDHHRSYCRLLFADFSSAFNTMQPELLVRKLSGLDMNPHIVAWVLEFLTDRVQYVQIGKKVSTNTIINTGAPQGCVLSPLLFTIYTNDCQSQDPNVPIIKFADDTTLQGLILKGNEDGYRTEISRFVSWCDSHHLELNVSKTRELIIDFRKAKEPVKPLLIKDQTVEQVPYYKYLGVTIDDKLQWNEHVKNLKQKICKRMYFLTKLKQFKIDRTLCTLFYRAVIESVITFCIAAWGGNCLAVDKRYINKMVSRAAKVTSDIDDFDELLQKATFRKISAILDDQQHPLNSRITVSERSGRPISIRAKSERHRKSFLPFGIRIFNNLR